MSSLSWNRSILAPYLLTAAGADSFIVNHDVRIKNSVINSLRKHTSEVISLNWSTNASYEQMKKSDASSIYLSSTSLGADVAIWKLSDLSYS